jgi:hypothetical protein
LVAATAAGSTIQFQKGAAVTVGGFFHGMYRVPGMPQRDPSSLPTTTGAALTRSSQGAMPIPAPSGTSYITSFETCGTVTGSLVLADRLIEYGGLVMNSTSTQTLSALALPSRATGATDVEVWLEVFTAGGNTASASVTMSYTNQAGTSGRTGTVVGGIPATGTPQYRSYPFALQVGDTGVQSVQSVTLGTSTGTAGNLGVVLRRCLLTGYMPGSCSGFQLGWAETDLQVCPDDACLELLYLASGVSSGVLLGNFGLSQG